MPGADLDLLVVGAGSIGARHARNLQSAGARVVITDPDAPRADAVAGVGSVPFEGVRYDDYDGVVIASPSVHHVEQTMSVLATDAKVLVEKPLATNTEGLDELVAAAAGRVMVGYNLRLHEPVARLIGLLHEGRVGRVHTARLWFGYYLPAWRSGIDYRTTYSAQADLGGGVLLDAIHELDLLVWMLGDEFEVVGATVDRLGDLEIDVEDTVRALLRDPAGALVEIELDYLSRRYRRGIEVVGDQATIRLDWAREVLEVETDDGCETTVADVSVDRSYELEAEAFLAFVRGDAPPPVDAAAGAASVRLAAQIRDAT